MQLYSVCYVQHLISSLIKYFTNIHWCFEVSLLCLDSLVGLTSEIFGIITQIRFIKILASRFPVSLRLYCYRHARNCGFQSRLRLRKIQFYWSLVDTKLIKSGLSNGKVSCWSWILDDSVTICILWGSILIPIKSFVLNRIRNIVIRR